MTSLMLAASAWNYVLIAVVVLLLIALPILMNARNKKETQKVQEQTNSLKVGDKVLTTSGVYGTITEIKFDETKKVVVIETGGKVKSYLTVDAYAIYTVLKNENEVKDAQTKTVEPAKTEEKAEPEVAQAEQEEPKQEAKKTPAKKQPAKKQTTTKKSPAKNSKK